MLRLVIGLAILLIFLTNVSATEVTSCTTISSPGYYHLANDIVNSTATTCIWIKTSDVILDGRGYKIDGVSSSSSNRYGILVYKSGESLTNITLANITVTNWGMGVYLQNVSHITLINVHLIDNYGDGIILKSSNNITIKNCSIADNDVGITIGYYTRNLTLVDSEVVGNYIGINYENTVEYYPNNTIYNNIFNNTKNVYSQVNFYSVWNTTKQAGTNIIGGSYLGGNAWFTPSRDGFSDTCIDDDGDGICDTPYNINAHSTDYLPLTYGNAPPDLSEYSISGTVYYYGTQSGEIYIEVFYEMPWEGAAPLYFENISAPGSYSINVTEGIYYVSAFMDVNGNGTYDEGEPFGVAINRTDWSMADAINVRGTSVTGVDITLYESQDTTPPVITFVAPTPTSNSVLSQSYIFVNVTSNEPLATALLEWNGVNITMNGRGTNWYLNMTGLSNGVYQFRVYGRDLAGNWNSTEVRSVTISTPLVEDNYVLRILVTANPSDMEEDNGFVIDLTVISGMCIIIEEENYRLHLTSNKQLRGLSVQPSDTTPPVITFVAPTPTSNSVLSQSYIFVNVTSNEPLATALLEWNGVNITMNGRGTNWYLNMTGLSNGVYQFRVYGRDLAGNWNSTEVRSVTISTPLVEDNYVLRILVTANPSDMEEDNGFVIDLTVISGMCIIIEEENYRLHLTSNKQLRGLSVQPSDTTPPVITFVAPTPTSNSVLSQSYIFVNVTSNEPLATALLEWNGVNITMNGRGTNWYLNMTGLSNGVYQFRVYGRDLAGNWNSTEVRNVTISTPLVEGGYILTLSLSSDFSRPSEEDGYAISLVIISRAGHVFEEGGYRIHLALQGLKSTIAKAQVSNTQPVAIFTIIPSPATINEEVEFNASLSYDPDGFIVDYTWNFGDGNITTTNQPIITHVYSSSGNYTVTLTVIDNDGSTNSLSKLLVVAVKGDFNDNNEVDIGDVSYVAYIVLGKMPQDLRADFNGNRRVDIGDLAKIAYYLIGKVDEL